MHEVRTFSRHVGVHEVRTFSRHVGVHEVRPAAVCQLLEDDREAEHVALGMKYVRLAVMSACVPHAGRTAIRRTSGAVQRRAALSTSSSSPPLSFLPTYTPPVFAPPSSVWKALSPKSDTFSTQRLSTRHVKLLRLPWLPSGVACR